MGARAAIVVFVAVLLLLFALAAVGYNSGRWEPNPPTVPPEQSVK